MKKSVKNIFSLFLPAIQLTVLRIENSKTQRKI